MDDANWNWEEKRYEMLAMLWRLLSQNINNLFDPPIVEEELINLIGKLNTQIKSTNSNILKLSDQCQNGSI